MIDTMTVLAYLLTHNPGHTSHLNLHASFPVNCAQQIESPLLRWSNVPPEAQSLALIIKDAPPQQPNKTAEKPRYYWVVYNLPIESVMLPYGTNLKINPNDVGINSWRNNNYQSPCVNGQLQPVEIELFALKKRFSLHHSMTGEQLEQNIKANALAGAAVSVSGDR